MFESLTDKFEGIFSRLGRKGVLTEADVDEVLREIRVALLEADVNLTVVKSLRNRIKERAVGEEVHKALNPAQQVIKIVNEELTTSLGGETIQITYASKPPTVVMMAGLQGSGKTTSSAKLARWFKSQGRNPLMVGADLQRPAAVEQLRTLGRQIDVPVYSEPSDPVAVAAGAIDEARKTGRDVVIVDTAGRLAIDEELMEEVRRISEVTSPDYTFLVVDAMTGQDAVTVAEAFHDKLELDGVILTKLDGDARGGAALSVKEVVGRPIAFAATGEKLEDFDLFHPDRMASRILGMGDMLTLIEKAEQTFEQEEAEEAAARLLEGQFTLDDFLEQMQQLKKMGPLTNLVGMLPGLPKEIRDVEIDDREVARIEAIIKSMTPAERADPDIIDTSRRTRIASGSGTQPTQVSGLISQFSEMRKMMKRFGGMGTKKARKPKRKEARKGKKGKKGGRVTAKGGGGRVTPKGGGRVTPKGEKSTKAPLMLPGLDRLDDSDLERLAGDLEGFDQR
jgi:signal recognition particle subunit SRP54